MNLSQALQLVSSVATKIDPKKSIKEQLSLHFVPTFWGRVALKDSLTGRLVTWIRGGFENKHKTAKQVQIIFSEALKTVDRGALGTVNDLSLRTRLFQEFLPVPSGNLRVLPQPEEIRSLEDDAAIRVQALTDQIYKESLLRSRSADQIAPITKTELDSLFGLNAEFSNHLLQIYFKQNPHFAHQDFEAKFPALQKGFEFRKSVEARFFSKEKPLTKEERTDLAQRLASQFCESVKKLPSGERLFFWGGFGVKVRTVDALFQIVKTLPKQILERLPTNIQEQLNKENPPDPKIFVEQTVAKVMGQLKAYIPDMDLTVLGPLLQDDTRSLPANLANLMPQTIRDSLERWLKQGLLSGLANVADLAPPPELLQLLSIASQNADLIGGNFSGLHLGLIGDLLNIASCIPKNELQSVLAWVSKHANQFKDSESKEKLVQELSQKIASYTQLPFDYVKGFLDRAVEVGFGQFQYLFSGDFFKLLGLELFDSGECWIEFIKQDNGKYTLSIYGSMGALKHHPFDPASNQKVWPLQIKDVDPEKMDPQLFQRLFYHLIEPQFESTSVSSGEDLYCGIIKYLEVRPEEPEGPELIDPEIHLPKVSKEIKTVETHDIDSSVTTPFHLAQVILSSPSASHSFIRFQMQVEAFIAYCHPYLTGPNNTLVIPDLDVAAELNRYVILLLVEGKKFKDLQIPNRFNGKRFYERLTFTEKEINQATNKLKDEIEAKKTPQQNPLNLPTEVLAPVREFIIQLGLSNQDIEAIIPPLSWALGDEIGVALQNLAETIGPLPPKPRVKNVQPSLPQESKGWLRDILSHVYYSMALEALKVAIACARVYRSGFSPLLVMPLLHQGLRQVLPKVIYDWYQNVLNQINLFILKLLFKLVYNFLLSNNQREQLDILQKQWQNALHSFSDAVLGNRRVSYELNPGARQENSEVLLTINNHIIHALHFGAQQGNSNISDFVIKADFENIACPTLAHLSSWLKKAKTFSNPDDELMFLLHHLEQLQIPNPHEDPWLDNIQDSERYLDVLTDLSLRLINNRATGSNEDQKKEGSRAFKELINDKYLKLRYDSNIHGRIVLSLFSILTLVDYKAKRCPKAKLHGYEVDAYPLLEWLRLPTTVMEKSSSIVQLRKICAYFFPDLDIDHLPSSEEIKQRAKKALFNYSFLESSFFGKYKIDLNDASMAIELDFNDQKTLPEIRYLAERAEESPIKKSMVETNFTKPYLESLLHNPLKNHEALKGVVYHFWKETLARPLENAYQNHCKRMGKKIDDCIGAGVYSQDYAKILNTFFLDYPLPKCFSNDLFYSKSKIKSRDESKKFIQDNSVKFEHFFNQEAFWSTDRSGAAEMQKRLWDAGFCRAPFDQEKGNFLSNFFSIHSHRDLGGWYEDSFFFDRPYDINCYGVHETSRFVFFVWLLQNPNLSDDFPVLHRAIEASFFTEDILLLDKLEILYLDSFDFRCGHILTPAFKYLKLQVHLSNLVINSFSPVKVGKIKQKKLRTVQFRKEYTWLHKFLSKWLAIFPKELDKSMVPKIDISTFNQYTPLLLRNQVRKQSDIMANPDSHLLVFAKESPLNAQLLEMIRTEQSDQIIRVLAFFNDNKRTLALFEIFQFYVQKLLFHATDLDKQLKTYPQTAITIAKFFNDLTLYFKEKGNLDTLLWLIETGIKIKSFCRLSDKQFPDFTQLLKKLSYERHLSNLERAKVAGLRLLSLDKDPKSSTDEEQREVTHACLDFIQLYTKDLADSSLYKLLFEVKEMMWKWNEFLNHRSENSSLDLADPSIAEQISKALTSLIGSRAKELDFSTGETTVKSKKGDLAVYRKNHLTNGFFVVTKSRGDKNYNLVPYSEISSERVQGKFTLPSSKETAELCVWLEDTTNGIKEVVIEDKHGNLVNKVLVAGKNKELSFFGIEFNGKILTPIPSSSASHALSAFTRFCPISEIECWSDPNLKQLARFTFKPYDLTFNVEIICGQPRGVDSEGFAIASNQNHTSLRGIVSYLLLEKGAQKKVIIRDGQWLSSLVNSLLINLGPLSYLAGSFLGPLIEKQKTTCFTYDIDSKGELVSDDPEALAYLITLYLLQRKADLALKACGVLESFCKHRTIGEKVVNLLLPLALVPFEFQSIPLIRQRLLSAVEENIMKPTTVETKRDIQEDLLKDALFTFITFYDLYQIQKNSTARTISDAQEWFLYKSLFRRSEKFLKTILTTLPQNWVEKMSWETVMECVVLPPELTHRYMALKNKSNLGNSWITKGVTLGREILAAPNITSFIPGMPNTSSLEYSSTMDIVHVCQAIGKNRFNLKALSFDRLKNLISSKIRLHPPLDLRELNAETFIHYFLTYYAIAKGDYRPDKRFFPLHIQYSFEKYKILKENERRFKSLLPLIKGGWDSESATLVQYLESVLASPFLYPHVDKFKKALIDDSPKSLEDFFKSISNRILASQVAFGAVPLAMGYARNAAIQYGMNSLVTPLIGSTLAARALIGIALPAIGWGSKVAYVAYHKTMQVMGASQLGQIVPQFQELNYACMDEDDALIDQELDKLHAVAFSMEMRRDLDQRVEVLPDEEDPVATQANRHVNQDITDYYARPDRISPRIRLKSEENLWDLYMGLFTYRSTLEKQLNDERKALLKIINPSHCKQPFSLEDLKYCLLKGDFFPLFKEIELSPELMPQMELGIVRYFARVVRLQQMNRALAVFEQLASIDSKTCPKLYEEKLEQLSDELKMRRTYRFEGVNFRLMRRLVLFEVTTNKMVWKKQYEIIGNLLQSGKKNVVIELLMGLGKTSFGIPMIDAYEADGRKIVFNIFLSALAATNIRDLSKNAKEIYGQSSNVLRFDRGMEISPQKLDTLQVILRRTLEKGEVIHITKEDGLALQLILIDKLQRYLHGKNQANGFNKICLSKILEALAIIRVLGKAIGDEAHEIFNQKQELNYPVGKSLTITSAYYKIIDACIRHFIQFPGILTLIQANKLNHLQQTQYETEVKPWIAQRMAVQFQITDQEMREYREYVVGTSKTIPQWIFQDKKRYARIAMLKGLLNVLIPLVSQRSVNVDYGMSMEGNGEYARPYNGNTSPMEQANIRNIYEAVTKTIFMFLSRGLDEKQVAKIVKMLKKKTRYEAGVANIRGEETAPYKLFATWIPKADILSLEKNDLLKVTEQLKFNPDAIFFYVQHFVKEQIRFWKQNIHGGPLELEGMFASGFYDTGTPNNHGTYPAKLEMFFDKGTIGEALHIINNKCCGISILKSDMPKTILQEVLETYFKEGSDFTALLDGSALLQGSTNDEVALAMQDHITKHRPDIHCIVFFQKNKEGRDQLVYMEKGSTKTYPFDTCKMPPEAYLSYYDQRHCVGTDIPHKRNAKGLNLIGDQATLERLLQENFRMRGLKKQKKVISEQGEDSAVKDTQTIHLAMTANVKRKISGDRDPTLRDTVLFVWHNEVKNRAQENWSGYLKKIRAVITRAVMDKFLQKCHIEDKLETVSQENLISTILNNVPDINTVIGLFKEFEDLFVTEVEIDPTKLFGLIEQETDDLAGVLKTVKEHAYKRIDQSERFSDEEKERIRLSLQTLPQPLFPTKVKIYTDGKAFHLDVLDDLEQEVEQEMGQEIEDEEEEEVNQEQELQNEQETTSIEQLERLSKFKEWDWLVDKINPYSLDWLKFMPIQEKQKSLLRLCIDQFTDTPLTPPLINARELIRESGVNYQFMAESIDQRIGFSNNFLPSIVRSFFEKAVDFGEFGQRELFEVLIHFEESQNRIKIQSVICLSQRDAGVWRKLLSKEEKAGKLKAVIYDKSLRTIVAGSNIDLNKFTSDEDLKQIEVQLKMINGDDYYPPELEESLVTWLMKHDLKQLRRAFQSIRTDLCKGLVEPASIVSQAFEEAKKRQLQLKGH